MQTILNTAKATLQAIKAPYPGIILDLEIREQFNNVVFLIVYRSNIEEFSESQKDSIGAWLVAVRQKVEHSIAHFGYQCILDGVAHVPS